MNNTKDGVEVKVAEIIRLIDEAYRHWEKFSDDHHCKSAEGAVGIHFGNYFERRDGVAKVRVEVYSYVFGPNRLHEFDSIDDALEEVRRWHAEEMSNTYD